MKKENDNSKRGDNKRSRLKNILLTLAAIMFVGFVLFPLSIKIFDGSQYGNVALIPIEGTITSGLESGFGVDAVNSQTIIDFIEDAEENSEIKVILLEINSPGGSAVASDEIGIAIKKASKPVVVLIREVGASGGYWIASAGDHIIANRMSITGSIGVISSYLEFSGLMEKYGVGYERLVSGEYKDLGTPFRSMTNQERNMYTKRLDKIQEFFIEEVAENRGMLVSDVEELATGEFFLGAEALDLGLIDELGNEDTAEEYIKENYDIEEIDYVVYQKEVGLFELLTGISSNFAFDIGQGIGSMLVRGQDNNLMLI